jgi:putative flippase GtrA
LNFSKEFITFALIGVFNTAVHTLVVTLCIEEVILNQVISNIIAFFIANIISFFLNSRYTFKIIPTIARYAKFFWASLISLGATILLSSIAQTLNLHYLIGIAMVVAIAPILTFAMQKYWAFKK